jgi:hypothetical protein
MPYFNSFRKDDFVFSKDLTKRVTNISLYTAIFSRIADNISFYTFYDVSPDQRLDSISQQLYGTTDFYWTIPILNKDIINTWNDLPKSTNQLAQFLALKHPGTALFIRDDQVLAGKFTIGETLEFNSTDLGTVIAKYPTRGYIQIDPIDASTVPTNTEFTIKGKTSLDEIVVSGTAPAFKAPANHIDSNGNSVPFNNGTPITIEEQETDRNEERSRIKVIRNEHITNVVKQFEREMNRRRL